MEFDTTQARFFFDGKRSLVDGDNNRKVDPRAGELIVNSFSQAAAANYALAIPYGKHPAMGDVNDLPPTVRLAMEVNQCSPYWQVR